MSRVVPIGEHTRAPDHRRGCVHTGLMYDTLVSLASKEDVQTVIEIGSTDGKGSTMAIREGLEKNPHFPAVKLYCIEAVRQMYDVLAKTRAPYMKCYRVCSTHPDLHYTDKEIERFFAVDFKEAPFDMRGMIQREHPDWHKRERDRYNAYFRLHKLPLDGVALIKDRNKIKDFDMALVDGGTYSGRADISAVYGAKYLVLDDIHTLKCRWSFKELQTDPNYEMIMHKPCTKAHFGYAAFRKV